MSKTKLRRGDRRAVKLALLLIASIPVSAWLATTAKADSQTDAYVAEHGPRVCAVLDAYPSFDGLFGIADAIHDDGFSYYNAGFIEGASIVTFCPRHLPLMKRFIAAYGGPSAAAPAGSIGGVFRA